MGNGIVSAVSAFTGSGVYSPLLEASAESGDDEGSFMIQLLKEFKIGNTTLHITTTHVSLAIVVLVLVIFAIIVNIKLKKADENATPGGLLNIVELIVETVDNMVKGIMGTNAKRFVNYIGTLFMLITFGLIQYNGIKKNKIGHFTSLFQPIWFLFPINIIGEFAVPLSLSLRLFGNVMSGTVLMGLIYGLLRPFAVGWPAILHMYFDIFSGCIQAYVICMLTMVYITDKIGD